MQPERDNFGFWTHPEFVLSNEWTLKQMILWLRQNNITIKMITLEDDNPRIFKRYEDGIFDVSDWNPTPPAGSGWFLVSIHVSDDGPACFWARHLNNA